MVIIGVKWRIIMEKSKGKVRTFLKKNAVYFLLAFCVIAIGLSVTLSLLKSNNPVMDNDYLQNENDVSKIPDEPVVEIPDVTPSEPVTKVVTFIMPVADVTEISEYSETMVWSSQLKRYSAHKAIDFFAPEGSKVYACYEGTIESVETTLLQGTTVVIDHGNGLKTVYNSLESDDAITVGQKVSQGDVIGYVSVTNRQESALGAHLHFEVIEAGENIDPAKYLTLEEK